MSRGSSGNEAGEFIAGLFLGALGIAILSSLFKPRCPNCNQQINKGDTVCLNCYQQLRW